MNTILRLTRAELRKLVASRTVPIALAMLATPRRGALVAAKVVGTAAVGAMLSVLTFGLGLVTADAELSAHRIHHLPADTGRLFAGSVIAGILFGLIGVALGYITRSTTAASHARMTRLE